MSNSKSLRIFSRQLTLSMETYVEGSSQFSSQIEKSLSTTLNRGKIEKKKELRNQGNPKKAISSSAIFLIEIDIVFTHFLNPLYAFINLWS